MNTYGGRGHGLQELQYYRDTLSFYSTCILLRKSVLDANVCTTTGSRSHIYTPR